MDSGQASFTGMRHFIGVVEDRNDPDKLGRVKVRVYSVHNSDKSLVPTELLPWAIVLNPVTSASMSGVGRSPTGIVEGSWVFGIFLDEGEFQQPLVMGTLVGNPSEPPNKDRGFNDPNEIYPLNDPELAELNESSVNRHARDETAEDHITLIEKRDKRIVNIETARAPEVKQVQPNKADSYYVRPKFDEPHPRFGGQGPDYPPTVPQSVYPLNHVWYTEAGHLFEVDDTPDAERIHWYHTTGTFMEVQPDGNRVTKVNGTDYEIIINDKDVLVKGSVNVRVEGDARLYVKGNMFTEVENDYFLTVGGDYIKKVAGNEAKEILSDQSIVINRDKYQTVHGVTAHIKIGAYSETNSNTRTETIVGKEEIKNFANTNRTVSGSENPNYSLKVAGNSTIITGSDLLIGSQATTTMKAVGDMFIKTDASQTINVATTISETTGGAVTESYGGALTTDATSMDINGGSSIDMDAGVIELN